MKPVAQPTAGAVHDELQAVVLAQDRFIGHAAAVGVVQAPVPLQLLGGVSMSFEHIAPGQVDVTPAAVTLQAVGPFPVPLHVPSFPQGGAGVQRVSAPFAVMLPHVPLARPVRAMLHAWQVLPQATLQQNPSIQFPPLHCPLMVQACPTGVSVQVPAVVSQALPFAQSVSTVQAVLHDMVVLLQLKGPHEVVLPATQAPALQVPAVVCMNDMPLPEHEAAPHETGVGVGQVSVPLQVAAGTMDEPMHVATLQVVVLPFLAQAPPAAHAPVLPHVFAAAAGHSGSTVPVVTDVQVPVEPDRLQAWQAPVQALLQQTPSTQFAAVLTQSDEVLHMAPMACFVPHTCVTVLQGVPVAQSLSVSHVVRHWVAFKHL